jgi:hypothetical protein
MPGFGRRFAHGGSTFYCGKVFSVRHLSCVSSPLSTGYISPTRFLTVAGALNTAQCALVAPLAGDVLGAVASDLPMVRSMLSPTSPMIAATAVPLAMPMTHNDGEKVILRTPARWSAL